MPHRGRAGVARRDGACRQRRYRPGPAGASLARILSLRTLASRPDPAGWEKRGRVSPYEETVMLKWIRYPLAAALAILPVVAAAAPPAGSLQLASEAVADAAVHQVQFRHRHHNGFGRGLGLGLGIGILGAIIANEAYGARPAYEEDVYAEAGPSGAPAEDGDDPRGLCAQHFRSFEWNTGLYTTPSGEKRVCPYLR